LSLDHSEADIQGLRERKIMAGIPNVAPAEET